MTTEKAEAKLLAEAALVLEGLRGPERTIEEMLVDAYVKMCRAMTSYLDVKFDSLKRRIFVHKKRKKHKKLKSCFAGKNPIKFVKPKKRRRRAKKGR